MIVQRAQLGDPSLVVHGVGVVVGVAVAHLPPAAQFLEAHVEIEKAKVVRA